MYLRWQRLLPRWVRLVPIELPGRGARMAEAFIEDFDALVTQLCREHRQYAHGRHAFFGHSMGSLVAHGMAVRWRQELQTVPEVLIASASPAPSRRDAERFATRNTDASLIEDLHKQGGTPREVFDNADMLQITLDTLRADYRICASHRYRREEPLHAPIHAFAGRDDDIEAERILAWESETSRRFSVRWFDGGHFYIRAHESAVLSALLQPLQSELSHDVSYPVAH